MKTKVKLRKGSAMYCDEVCVTGDGRQTYVWVGKEGRCVCNFGGESMLRKFAKDILKALRTKRKAGVK